MIFGVQIKCPLSIPKSDERGTRKKIPKRRTLFRRLISRCKQCSLQALLHPSAQYIQFVHVFAYDVCTNARMVFSVDTDQFLCHLMALSPFPLPSPFSVFAQYCSNGFQIIRNVFTAITFSVERIGHARPHCFITADAIVRSALAQIHHLLALISFRCSFELFVPIICRLLLLLLQPETKLVPLNKYE